MVSNEVVPSSSFQGQGMRVDLIDIHPSSSVKVISSMKVSEQSPVAGLVGTELPTIGVHPTPMSSSSSSEKQDYSEMTMLTGMMCILLLIPANILTWPKRRCR